MHRLAFGFALLAALRAPAARADGWVSAFSELRPAPADLSDARLPLGERVALARAFGSFGPERDVVPVLLATLQVPETPPLLRDEILLSIARRAPAEAAEPLAARLAAEREVSPALCMALAAIGTPRALQALVGALARSEGAAIAERALARAGEHAAPPLAAALAGPSAVRAARVLGEIGEPALARSSGALVRALGAPQPELRAAAADALGRMRAAAAAPVLVRLLGDRAPEVARAALRALAELATPAQGPALAAHLARAAPAERPLALRALAAADPARALRPLEQALSSGPPELREEALLVLEGERPSAHWVPLLSGLFARELREATASALARVPEGRGLPALLRVGRRAPEAAERAARAVALVLRRHGEELSDEQREQAHGLLRSLPSERRLRLLALARDRHALSAIREGLVAKRAGERAAAASAVALLGDGEATPALIAALARERDLEAARSMTLAALQLGARAPYAALRRLLALREIAPEAMQLAAASAARRAPDDALRVYLRRALASRWPARVRVAAALALGALGEAGALAPLRAALSDPSTRVRLAAVRALGALGGGEAAHACAAHARVERDALVRRAAQALVAREGRPVALAERGELVLEARALGVDDERPERPLIDVLLEDGRWLRMRAGAGGELIVADLPAGRAELRRVE